MDRTHQAEKTVPGLCIQIKAEQKKKKTIDSQIFFFKLLQMDIRLHNLFWSYFKLELYTLIKYNCFYYI